MNNRGGIVLRDLYFMIVLVMGIILLAGTFVSQMAISYNTLETAGEYNGSLLYSNASGGFTDLSGDLEKSGQELGNSTGIISFVGGTLSAAGNILVAVLRMPYDFGKLIGNSLIAMNVNTTLANIIMGIIITLIWALIIFAIVSAFLQGGRL